MEGWTPEKSLELYGALRWGDGYFGVNDKGNLVVRPSANGQEIDLFETTQMLVRRGIEAPVLFRFDGIIKNRIERLNKAFTTAIEQANYTGKYRGVFPIKVNQQRHVVEAIQRYGRATNLGLEVGSKPELIAVLAIQDNPEALLLCNGYKDLDYIELAMLGRKLGRRVIIILEQLSEVKPILDIAEKLNVEIELGIRMKPIARGAGHWENSGGEQAKFGLRTAEIMVALELLKQRGKESWVTLLHYHVGSQITSITAIQKVLKEATRMYAELSKLCPNMKLFDVGGGLAVDYDGSRTNFPSSMNYTMDEYARDVVDAIQVACSEADIPAPDIVTEAGRALTAHHAVLVFPVAEISKVVESLPKVQKPEPKQKTLVRLYEMYEEVSVKNCQEFYNDAQVIRDEVLQRFITGDLSLAERAHADSIYWHLMQKIKTLSVQLRHMPEDLEKLNDNLRDTYFCSFSVFQSMPDSWAIGQLFPVMPIHKHHIEPNRKGILCDMSCDSDGQIDSFVDLKDVKNYLPLHDVRDDETYYLGAFLVGAYQEILGDLHNLFGDNNVVHLDVNSDGKVEVLNVVEGDTVREVLSYVQYNPSNLITQWRIATEKAAESGAITDREAAQFQKRYLAALDSYTYYQVFEEEVDSNKDVSGIR
jgi:arginine decarboxylase